MKPINFFQQQDRGSGAGSSEESPWLNESQVVDLEKRWAVNPREWRGLEKESPGEIHVPTQVNEETGQQLVFTWSSRPFSFAGGLCLLCGFSMSHWHACFQAEGQKQRCQMCLSPFIRKTLSRTFPAVSLARTWLTAALYWKGGWESTSVSWAKATGKRLVSQQLHLLLMLLFTL